MFDNNQYEPNLGGEEMTPESHDQVETKEASNQIDSSDVPQKFRSLSEIYEETEGEVQLAKLEEEEPNATVKKSRRKHGE